MKIYFAIATIGLGLLSLASCSGVKQLSAQESTQLNKYTESDLSYKSQFRFKYLFFEAQRLKAIEEYDKAAELMEQCIAIDPNNADANFVMAQLYMMIEQIDNALFYALKSKELNPKNKWAYQQLIMLYRSIGDVEGELQAYRDLLHIDPSNIEVLYDLAQSYTQFEQFKKAIKVYEDIERKTGVNEEVSVVKERIYIAMGDVDKAADELKKLIEVYPSVIRYRGMLAELYQANNFTDKALEVYMEILSVFPDEPRANMALAEHYRIQKDYAKAFEYLDVSFNDVSFDEELKFQILLTYFQLALDEESYVNLFLSLLENAIKLHPKQAKFYALKGDMFFHKNKSEQAFDAYANALRLGATEFLIWNRYLVLGLEFQKYELVASEGEKAIRLHPVQPMLYLFTGLAYSVNNKHSEAVELLKKGLNYVINNRPLKAEFYNYLADAFHSMGQYEQSDSYYEKSLAIIPDNPIVLNNYSYYLSLRSENLEKAELLSKKCIELSPNESTYQDTYGWILYKMGRYDEAEQWLKKAVANSGVKSGVILEHYGDALYKVNRKEEAKEYWQKALDVGGASDFIIEKVRQGVLYE